MRHWEWEMVRTAVVGCWLLVVGCKLTADPVGSITSNQQQTTSFPLTFWQRGGLLK